MTFGALAGDSYSHGLYASLSSPFPITLQNARMCPMDETLEIRLSRIAARFRVSRETFQDDTKTLHKAVREADEAGKSVRWIARKIGFSSAQTHRIMTGLTGPDSVN